MTARQPIPASSFLIENLDWDTYVRVLDAFGERHVPHTYADGTLELMTISYDHEWVKNLLASFILLISRELKIRIASAGSTTLRREIKARGLEPDESYYVANSAAVKGLKQIDLNRVPPPDLVIEVDVTSKSLSRQDVYAKLGVTELWRWHRRRIHFLRRASDSSYEPIETSIAFPQIGSADIQRFLDRGEAIEEYDLMTEFEQWLRSLKKNKKAK